ncbi:MAG TPA: hypothetical protein P5567_00425 [Kiritimatiellia bacterium]|nr:hypothetical protein [Kiritimatiellia bacterium]HRZ10899.1 hypothetical protein [Kiritimatiellia bacterium]HSA18828.1 hypothetical protein [Kiritimatiellia bacterium]
MPSTPRNKLSAWAAALCAALAVLPSIAIADDLVVLYPRIAHEVQAPGVPIVDDGANRFEIYNDGLGFMSGGSLDAALGQVLTWRNFQAPDVVFDPIQARALLLGGSRFGRASLYGVHFPDAAVNYATPIPPPFDGVDYTNSSRFSSLLVPARESCDAVTEGFLWTCSSENQLTLVRYGWDGRAPAGRGTVVDLGARGYRYSWDRLSLPLDYSQDTRVLDYDPAPGELWVLALTFHEEPGTMGAFSNSLLCLDGATGEIRAEVAGFRHVDTWEIDPRNRTLWVADRSSIMGQDFIYRIDLAGLKAMRMNGLTRFAPDNPASTRLSSSAFGLEYILDMSVSPLDGAVWMLSRRAGTGYRLAKLDAAGTLACSRNFSDSGRAPLHDPDYLLADDAGGCYVALGYAGNGSVLPSGERDYVRTSLARFDRNAALRGAGWQTRTVSNRRYRADRRLILLENAPCSEQQICLSAAPYCPRQRQTVSSRVLPSDCQGVSKIAWEVEKLDIGLGTVLGLDDGFDTVWSDETAFSPCRASAHGRSEDLGPLGSGTYRFTVRVTGCNGTTGKNELWFQVPAECPPTTPPGSDGVAVEPGDPGDPNRATLWIALDPVPAAVASSGGRPAYIFDQYLRYRIQAAAPGDSIERLAWRWIHPADARRGAAQEVWDARTKDGWGDLASFRLTDCIGTDRWGLPLAHDFGEYQLEVTLRLASGVDLTARSSKFYILGHKDAKVGIAPAPLYCADSSYRVPLYAWSVPEYGFDTVDEFAVTCHHGLGQQDLRSIPYAPAMDWWPEEPGQAEGWWRIPQFLVESDQPSITLKATATTLRSDGTPVPLSAETIVLLPCPINGLLGSTHAATAKCRKFKAKMLMGSAEGRKIISAFYRLAPEMSALLAKDRVLSSQCAAFLKAVQPDLAALMQKGNPKLSPLAPENLKLVTPKNIQAAKDIMTRVKPAASADLRSVIDELFRLLAAAGK